MTGWGLQGGVGVETVSRWRKGSAQAQTPVSRPVVTRNGRAGCGMQALPGMPPPPHLPAGVQTRPAAVGRCGWGSGPVGGGRRGRSGAGKLETMPPSLVTWLGATTRLDSDPRVTMEIRLFKEGKGHV